MLKHVQISPLRNRSDSLSLRSSTSCSSSLCGSPEPPVDMQRTPSRASSYTSLNDPLPQTTIKIHTSCLRIDIEYKTLGIQWDTTSKEVIGQLLRRLKMRHRDPRLFYLSMEVTVRRAGVKTVLVLDDEARPAILQACHPKGDSRFCLQLKPGGLVRVHTSALQSSSQYKSLVISEETTSDELLSILLSCYNSIEPVEQFSLYEVCPGQEYQRKLHPDDLPLRAQLQRVQRSETCHFLVRRNPNYPKRRQLLPPIVEKNASSTSVHSLSSDSESVSTSESSSSDECKMSLLKDIDEDTLCKMCRNTFKSCEFCNKNSLTIVNQHPYVHQLPAYSPVYNIREIRTASHSFSSLGSDKKLLEVERGSRISLPNQSNCNQLATTNTSESINTNTHVRNHPSSTSSATTINVASSRPSSCHLNKHRHSTSAVDFNSNFTSLGGETVKNNPSKGFGHYVYI